MISLGNFNSTAAGTVSIGVQLSSREKHRTLTHYPSAFPCGPSLIISLATELVVIVEHSREGTHWHYTVPSERLTRETFHSVG